MLSGLWEIGDPVRIESIGVEGTIQFLGQINGKTGEFAGVELLAGFAGKGKNDGSVDGCVERSCLGFV